jgi:enoyl-CoA hydratase/carnithine racemase
MTEDALLFETLGRVARLTLNRPKAMNLDEPSPSWPSWIGA